MTFKEISNQPFIYIMVLFGILFIVLFAVVSMRKSWKRALEIGFQKEQLMNIVKTSISYTIVPSLAIVVGFFSIAALLGIPWPWWRLSVLGSVTYEIMAAKNAMEGVGVDVATATATDFVLVMYAMSIGIIGGLFLAPFISEKIQEGTMNLKEKDAKWGALGNSVFMLTILVVFIIPIILGSGAQLMTLFTSALITVVLSWMAKKFQLTWLHSFILAISLLLAMASSVFWVQLFS